MPKTYFAFVPVIPCPSRPFMFKLNFIARSPWSENPDEALKAARELGEVVRIMPSSDFPGIPNITRKVFALEGELYALKSAIATAETGREVTYFCIIHRELVLCKTCQRLHFPRQEGHEPA